MHHFLVVARRGSPGPLSEMTNALLDDPEPRAVSFRPAVHIHWLDTTKRLHFAGWSAEPPAWKVSRSGAIVSVAGHPIVTDPRDSNADSTLEHLERTPDLSTLASRLDGAYAILSLGPDASGGVINDPFGLHPLYIGGTDQISVVSNRPSLVASVIARETGTPARQDAQAAAWVAFAGQMFGDATGFLGVSATPFGSSISIQAPYGLTVREHHLAPWVRRGDASLQSMLERSERRLIQAMRAAVSAFPNDCSSELTGGKDSRLVLALASRAELVGALQFFTYGHPHSPDCEAATAIANALNLRYTQRPWPSKRGSSILDHFVEHVQRVSGQLGCWEMSNPTRDTGLTLSGLSGESLRTNYPRWVGKLTADDAIAAFDRHQFGRYTYLLPEVRESLRRRVRFLFTQPLESGCAPEDLFDVFYIQHRLRRWIGARPDRFVRHVFPLYAPLGVEAAFAMGWQARAEARFHEAIQQKAALGIDAIPFVRGQTWRKNWQPGRPSPPSAEIDQGHRGSTSEVSGSERGRPIQAAIAAHPANAAFDIVNREAMMTDAKQYHSLDRRAKIELHQALTVVLWLGSQQPL